MNKPFLRICPPSKYDEAPFKTICYVNEEHRRSVYIQVSEVGEPEWVEMGKFLLQSLNDHITNSDYIDRWMEDYLDDN